MNFKIILGLLLVTSVLSAEVFYTPQEARQKIWGDEPMRQVDLILTKEQAKSIKKSSRVRIRERAYAVWKTESGGWFILDHVIGKHENIDIAIGITSKGRIKDIEVLEYRETYGSEVKEKPWLKQFYGRSHKKVMKLDNDITNISGATLSSRHITDGVNRWLHTWDQVLRYL